MAVKIPSKRGKQQDKPELDGKTYETRMADKADKDVEATTTVDIPPEQVPTKPVADKPDKNIAQALALAGRNVAVLNIHLTKHLMSMLRKRSESASFKIANYDVVMRRKGAMLYISIELKTG